VWRRPHQISADQFGTAGLPQLPLNQTRDHAFDVQSVPVAGIFETAREPGLARSLLDDPTVF